MTIKSMQNFPVRKELTNMSGLSVEDCSHDIYCINPLHTNINMFSVVSLDEGCLHF